MGKRYVLQGGGFYELFTDHCPQPFSCFWQGGNGYLVETTLPDYLSDLNAMHEAEKDVIVFPHVGNYCDELIKITSKGIVGDQTLWNLLHAPAAQRAEALLRTLNLWKDE